jgi:hypothetical protein
MKSERPRMATAAALLLTPCVVFGVASTSDDRIALSADGTTLTGTNGGGGGSVGWLHNFDADSLAAVAVEHQVIANAHWTFGSLSGALTRDSGDGRYTFYAEAHEGAGDDGPRAFHYATEAAGVSGTYFHRFSAQLEDRQIDVKNIHGNLPKLGLSYLWTPHLLTSVSYAYSVNGNLGTRLTSVRIDTYGSKLSFLAGVAFGQASPIVLGNVADKVVVLAPGQRLKEGYVGVTKPLPRLRSELTLVADYQDLSGSKRATVTLNYIFHVGGAGTAR